MARRRSFMATRMSKLKGVTASEKQILTTIGGIVDIGINNRTPTNPRGTIRKAGKQDPRLPPVKNLNVQSGVRSVKIRWDPVDGTILENYALTITNLDTGETQEAISYTSSFVFKGESGNYKAQIKPIGRNGVAAPVRVIVFEIADSVMILEGAKNGVSTESPFVSEVILTPADYIVFAWAAFVLNSFASPLFNSEPIVQLRYGDDLATSTLVQAVSMFGESETATNLNDLDYGGILRPLGPTRTGNFETSHTTMFAPFNIPDSIANQSTRFWVVVTNRDSEADVISCSIALWVGSGGRGELGVTPVAVVNPRSIDLDGTNSNKATGILSNLADDVEDEFTVAFWVKPFDLETLGNTDNYFFFAPDNNTNRNRIEIANQYTFTAETHFIVNVFNGAATESITIEAETTGPATDIWTNGQNEWNFIVAVFNKNLTGTDRLKAFINGQELVTAGPVTVANDGGAVGDMTRDLATYVTGNYSVQTGNVISTRVPQSRYNSMGIWNSALSAAEIVVLYNDGAGANVDWRENTGSYTSSADLGHYWLFGLDTTDDITICDDYGNSLFFFNMNDSFLLTAAVDVVTDAPV